MSGNLELFTTRMRKATRKIHSVSDALVNAKFAISLRDEAVWGGGLFVFYHIFGYLEDAKERLKMLDFDKLFTHEILFRKAAFEQDLDHYLGYEWRSFPKSLALENYLEHLQDLEKENPKLLLAYVYHLYLGLLSGGQILAKKRRMFGEMNMQKIEMCAGTHIRSETSMDKWENKLQQNFNLEVLQAENTSPSLYVDKVTDFGTADISQLKNDFRQSMNEIAEKMSEDEQNAFIEESNRVFLMNNLIVNSVGGQNKALYSLLYKASALCLVVAGVIIALRMHK